MLYAVYDEKKHIYIVMTIIQDVKHRKSSYKEAFLLA